MKRARAAIAGAPKSVAFSYASIALSVDLRPVSAMPISNHASPALGDFGYLSRNPRAKSKASSDCFC